MKIGVDYYPEQWEKSLWQKDAKLMQETGIKVVRLAEFAWSRLEPVEGEYDFLWLDEAIEIFNDHGIAVILSTPTATPPLWLFEKYPQTIQVDKITGKPVFLGVRGHRCISSPVFRGFAEKIIRIMVQRYRDFDGVIGYQIDNELEANHCCCPVCQENFRQWMKEKYQDLHSINISYGNSVWSGEYSSFEQIKPPMGPNQKWLHPSLQLDFNRYASDSTFDYVEFQRRLILECDPDAIVTTNTWLCENMPDFYQLFQNLDVVSYDNYPVTKLPDHQEELYSHAFHLDLMRGIKKKNFWIMEQLSGALGSWMPMSRTPQPGMIFGYAMQAIAHGADVILHFRWRTAISGAEMYWHGILDHNNIPGRRYQEFKLLCETVNQCDFLDGTVVKNKVALLYGSEQEYAFKIQHQAEGMYYLELLKSLHDAFLSIGVGVDIINQTDDLSEYDIVLAPNLMILNPDVQKNLYQFVQAGGSLLLTYRCGVKDIHNTCIMDALPTVYKELIGAEVLEYDAIGNEQKNLEILSEQWRGCQQEKEAVCTRWCDVLQPDTAQVLAVYADSYYLGMPAVTRNAYGDGQAYYLGTQINRLAMISFAKMLAAEKGIEYFEDLPPGVEVTYRGDDTKKFRFIFNNNDHEVRYQDGEVLQPFEMRIEESA